MSDAPNKRLKSSVAFAWAGALGMIGVGFWHLAVGFSWTLPLIGTVSGPPTPVQQILHSILFLSFWIGGCVATVYGLAKGSGLQRLLLIPPALVCAAFLLLLIAEALE